MRGKTDDPGDCSRINCRAPLTSELSVFPGVIIVNDMLGKGNKRKTKWTALFPGRAQYSPEFAVFQAEKLYLAPAGDRRPGDQRHGAADFVSPLRVGGVADVDGFEVVTAVEASAPAEIA